MSEGERAEGYDDGGDDGGTPEVGSGGGPSQQVEDGGSGEWLQGDQNRAAFDQQAAAAEYDNHEPSDEYNADDDPDRTG